jgi:hypothetical protein
MNQPIQCTDEDLQELKRLALAVRAASDDDNVLGVALDEYDEHANPDQVLCLFEKIDRVTAERDAALVEVTKFKDEAHTDGMLRVRYGKEIDALQQRLTAADERADTATSLIHRIVANFDTEIKYHEDVEPNDLEHDQVLTEMREFLNTKDADWRMNPCKNGHRDVGAAGGVAHCYTCDEKITAASTQEAFEQWNATHPAT